MVMEKKKPKEKCTQVFYVMIVLTLVSSLFVGIVYGGNVSQSSETNRSLSTTANFQLEEPSSILAITILNESTALGEWFIHVPSELVSYIPIEKNRLKENVDSLEKGMEDLFLQDVMNIEIIEGNETLIVNFNLKGDYTNGFVTGQYRYTYELTTYAPVGLNVLKIVIPQNKTLVSINPGPNEMKANEMVYYDYNWAYPIEIHYAEESTRAAKIGDEWALRTLPVKSKEFFGENENSKFAIPDDWVGWGDDTVPETSKTAYEIAEEYKPRLYNRTDQCPDAVYYRVFKGKDPYIGFDAYLIQYFAYWNCQDCAPVWHEYDCEPIFIWVRNIEDKYRPYRVAYDYWNLINLHLHEIHRTYLWSSPSDYYPADWYKMPPGVFTQDKSYYPFGRSKYNQDGWYDIRLNDLSSSLKDNWDGNHVKLGIANCYHTFDTDISGTDCGKIYALSPLTDKQLIDWYRIALDDDDPCDICDCDPWEIWSVMPFKYDISDPFYGVFWEDRYGWRKKCDFPSISGIVKSAEVNNKVLTVAVSVLYDNSHAGGKSGRLLRGLGKNRFLAVAPTDTGYITIGTPKYLDERSAGEYILEFDVSGIDINSRICLHVWNFFGPLCIICNDISVVDKLNILAPTQTAYQNVGAHNEPIKTNIEVEIKTSDDKFIPGLTIIKDYTVKIGDKTAKVITVDEKSDRYVLEIMPPKQAGDGKYDLHVGLGSFSDVENNAINYGTKGLDVALIIDSSGSMSWNDPQGYRKTAAKYFVDLASIGDQICVADFGYSSCNSRLLLQLLEITDESSRDTVKTAIDKVVEVGMTPIGGGLKEGYNELSSPRAVAGHNKAGILLTDGKDTCGTKGVARTYAQKFGDNGWFLYTIGLTGAADEDLLQELATLGNGEYYKAPTNVQLMEIYNAISGRVAGEQTMRTAKGTVQQDFTSVVNALIDSSVTKARFTISWAGSDLNLTLKKPDGGIIDPDVAKADPNIDYTSASSYEFYTVKSPMPGEWELRIFGVDVPAGGEDYTASVMGTTNLTMNMYFDRDHYSVGEPIKVSVSLTDAIQPITEASVTADVELSPAASSSLKNLAGKDNLTEEEKLELANLRSISLQNRLAIAPDQITLFDDGMHGDGMANDGVYANFYTNTDIEGTYQFTIKADGARSLEGFEEEEFERTTKKSMYVSDAPILGLSVSPAIWDITSMSDTSVEKSFTVESSTNTIASIFATDLTDGFGNVIELSNFGFNPSILHLPVDEPQELIANLSIPLNSPVGNYAGSIIITTPEGTLDIELEITVISNPPIADANGPYAGVIEYIAVPITFDGTGSYDPDGTIKKYAWDLDNDGKFDDAFGATPTVSFTAPYSSNINLKVTDNNGATDTDTTTLTITKHSPPPNGIHDGLLMPPEQPQCYRGTSTIQGKGNFTIDESIQDWATAIDTTEHIEGTGEFAMDSKRVLNQAANPSDFYDPNFYYKKTMQFQGNATNRLISRDKFESSGIFGGTGTRINEYFDVSMIQKDESGSIKTISAPGSGQSHRFATMDDFSGIWGIHSEWQKICQKDIRHHQMFIGNFSVQKDLTFEREVVIP
jgi:Mg-chelatase subunit ChlD